MSKNPYAEPENPALPPSKHPTRIEKLWTWLKAFEDGLNYDPRVQTLESYSRLNQQIEQLQTRVKELEKAKKQEV